MKQVKIKFISLVSVFVFVIGFLICSNYELTKRYNDMVIEVEYLKHYHKCCLDFKVSENKRMSLQKHVNKLVSEYSKKNYYLPPEYNSIEYFTPSADFFIFENYFKNNLP